MPMFNTYDGRDIFIPTQSIVSVTASRFAGDRGINSVVKTIDGKLYEIQETVVEARKLIEG